MLSFAYALALLSSSKALWYNNIALHLCAQPFIHAHYPEHASLRNYHRSWHGYGCPFCFNLLLSFETMKTKIGTLLFLFGTEPEKKQANNGYEEAQNQVTFSDRSACSCAFDMLYNMHFFAHRPHHHRLYK